MALKRSQFNQAVYNLTKALILVPNPTNKDPKSPDCHPRLAELYAQRSEAFLNLREEVSSLEDARKSVALDPKSPDCHTRLALALWYSGSFSESVNYFVSAIRLNALFPGSKDKDISIIAYFDTRFPASMDPILKSANKLAPFGIISLHNIVLSPLL